MEEFNENTTNSLIVDPLDLLLEDEDAKCIDLDVVSDVEWADNQVDCIVNKRFLNQNPFPVQTQHALNLFECFCPHCSNPKYLITNPYHGNIQIQFKVDEFKHFDEMRDDIVLLRSNVCPKCKTHKLNLYDNKLFVDPYEFNACIGQRGGKSALTAMIANACLHFWLSFNNPAQALGLMKNQMLQMWFISLTEKQAGETIWERFTGVFDTSPWFAEYVSYLQYKGKTVGIKLYERLKTFMCFKVQNILAEVKGADVRTSRGRTRIFGTIDEIGWFDIDAERTKVKISAEGAYSEMKTSLATVRAAVEIARKKDKICNIPQGFMINISSPSSQFDKIMDLVRSGEKERRIITCHMATWECNPNLPITLDYFQEVRRTNPIMFETNYMAVPPLAAKPFIMRTTFLEKAYTKDIIPILKFSERIEVDNSGRTFKYLEPIDMIIDQAPRILAIDQGVSHNNYAIVSLSYKNNEQSRIDFVANIVPDSSIQVSLDLMYKKCIIPLVSKYNYVVVLMDQWNSYRSTQELKQGKSYSLKLEDFYAVKNAIESGNVFIPQLDIDMDRIIKDPTNGILLQSPYANLILQILTVRISGRRVLKPLHGEDDIFRALSLAVMYYLKNPNKFVSNINGRRSLLKGTPIVSATVSKYGNTGNISTVNGVVGLATAFKKGR